MKKISYSNCPGFSGLFIDFIDGAEFFDSRFPMNRDLFRSAESIGGIAERFGAGKKIAGVIERSMSCVALSDSQKKNLAMLNSANVLFVVTGQQAGFLGGPAYSVLKAFTAAAVAQKLNKTYKDFVFIPLFWVEDNDHDNLEASLAFVYDNEFKPVQFICSGAANKENLTSVSELRFNDDIYSVIDEVISLLPKNESFSEISSLMKEIYLPGISWSGAFIKLISRILAPRGMLFVSAAEIRKAGLFGAAILRELEIPGKSNEIVNQANALLLENGYKIQARSSEINLFLHENGKRLKIVNSNENIDLWVAGGREYSSAELVKLAIDKPASFSPKVLLRPVFQDSVMPTAAYIGGPAEIAYCSQIKELHQYFNIGQPAFLPRVSATFLIPKISRFLEKNSLEVTHFWRQFSIIEKELTVQLSSARLINIFESIEDKLKVAFDEIEQLAGGIEQSYVRSAQATAHNIFTDLGRLKNKMDSASKKQFSEKFTSYAKAHNYLFPKSALQERIISVVSLMSLFGLNGFGKLCESIAEEAPDAHYVV